MIESCWERANNQFFLNLFIKSWADCIRKIWWTNSRTILRVWNGFLTLPGIKGQCHYSLLQSLNNEYVSWKESLLQAKYIQHSQIVYPWCNVLCNGKSPQPAQPNWSHNKRRSFVCSNAQTNTAILSWTYICIN